MAKLLLCVCGAIVVFASVSLVCADKPEKVLYNQKFKLVDPNDETKVLGTRHYKAVEKGAEILISEEVTIEEYRGKKAGFKSKVKYRTAPALAPYHFEGETTIDGKTQMKGTLTISNGKADISVKGFFDRRGNPANPPLKMEKKGLDMPKGTLILPQHLRILGPKILGKPGDAKEVIYVEFPDDLRYPEFMNWKEGFRLVRHKAQSDGSFEIEVIRAVEGEGEHSAFKLKFDSKGKYLSEVLTRAKFKEIPIEKSAEHQILGDLEGKLKKLLKELSPDAKVKIENDELIGRHKTGKFTVHPLDKNGRLSEKTREEVGPDEKGFLLRLRLHKGDPQARQAKAPQILKGEFWQTYLNAYPIEWRKGEYIWMTLSYRDSTDKKLVEKIKETVTGYAKKDK